MNDLPNFSKFFAQLTRRAFFGSLVFSSYNKWALTISLIPDFNTEGPFNNPAPRSALVSFHDAQRNVSFTYTLYLPPHAETSAWGLTVVLAHAKANDAFAGVLMDWEQALTEDLPGINNFETAILMCSPFQTEL